MKLLACISGCFQLLLVHYFMAKEDHAGDFPVAGADGSLVNRLGDLHPLAAAEHDVSHLTVRPSHHNICISAHGAADLVADDQSLGLLVLRLTLTTLVGIPVDGPRHRVGGIVAAGSFYSLSSSSR